MVVSRLDKITVNYTNGISSVITFKYKVKSVEEWDDSSLVQSFQHGNENAFAEIDKRFRGRLVRFFVSRVRSVEAAEDLTQEVLLKAYVALPTLRDGVFLAGWMKKIAFHSYVDWIRRNSREKGYIPYEEVRTEEKTVSFVGSCTNPLRPNGQPYYSSLPDESVVQKEECQNLWQVARNTLTPVEFQILWLRYEDELNDEDIAISLGKKTGAIRTALSRARKKLTKIIKKERQS